MKIKLFVTLFSLGSAALFHYAIACFAPEYVPEALGGPLQPDAPGYAAYMQLYCVAQLLVVMVYAISATLCIQPWFDELRALWFELRLQFGWWRMRRAGRRRLLRFTTTD